MYKPIQHLLKKTILSCYFYFTYSVLLGHGVMVITAAHLHWTKPELIFFLGLNSAGGDLQWWQSRTVAVAGNKA